MAIINYHEQSPPKATLAELGLYSNETFNVYYISNHFMHSGFEGDKHTRVYHHNGTTIIVNQSEISGVADWRKDITTGWKARRFTFAGDEEQIKGIVKTLEEHGEKIDIRTP